MYGHKQPASGAMSNEKHPKAATKSGTDETKMDSPKQPSKSDACAKMDSDKQPASVTLSEDKQLLEATKSGGDEVQMDNSKQVKHASKSGSDETIAVRRTVNDDDDNCILFGRGKGVNNRPANKRMRQVIDNYRDDYLVAGRGGKRKLVNLVHGELVEAGMKFLKQEKGRDGWIEADTDEAIKKVGHALRCNRERSKSETESVDESNVASRFSAATYPHAMVHGQVVQGNSAVVFGENVAGLPVLSRMSTTGTAGFLSSGFMGHQDILGSALPVPSNPLLSLGRIPIATSLTSLFSHPPVPMGLTVPPAGLDGLSSVDLYVMIERERQLRQAMLYSDILRNTERR